jgi:hypothetical protein
MHQPAHQLNQGNSSPRGGLGGNPGILADRKQQAERNQLACCLQGLLQAVRQIAAAWQRLPRC